MMVVIVKPNAIALPTKFMFLAKPKWHGPLTTFWVPASMLVTVTAGADLPFPQPAFRNSRKAALGES